MTACRACKSTAERPNALSSDAGSAVSGSGGEKDVGGAVEGEKPTGGEKFFVISGLGGEMAEILGLGGMTVGDCLRSGRFLCITRMMRRVGSVRVRGISCESINSICSGMDSSALRGMRYASLTIGDSLCKTPYLCRSWKYWNILRCMSFCESSAGSI